MVNSTDVVYYNTADGGKFSLSVARKDAHTGQMTVKVEETGEILLDKPVVLSYEAVFGPDEDDVLDWQQAALVAVDEWIARND